MDIRLPCGGGLDILIVPRPDRLALARVRDYRERRTPCALDIDMATGEMAVTVADVVPAPGSFRIDFVPEIRFLTFGKGPEAATFAALTRSIGFPGLLLSPDPETRDIAEAAGCETRALSRPGFPDDLDPDPWTAVLAFFHDHEWEPPILGPALASPAFYVGAQGSRRSAMARNYELEAMGVGADDIARLRGPIGLVASARDARTLAVSVLAEVLEVARGAGRMTQAA
jgi:xanthine dehydrogenase accessory factor